MLGNYYLTAQDHLKKLRDKERDIACQILNVLTDIIVINTVIIHCASGSMQTVLHIWVISEKFGNYPEIGVWVTWDVVMKSS